MLRTLTRNGYVSPNLLASYHVYKLYTDIKNVPKMKRYGIVAKETRQSVTTVRRAVSEMKSYVKN